MSLDDGIRYVLRMYPEGLTTSGLARQLAVMERDALVLAEVHRRGRRQWTTWRLPPGEAWSS